MKKNLLNSSGILAVAFIVAVSSANLAVAQTATTKAPATDAAKSDALKATVGGNVAVDFQGNQKYSTSFALPTVANYLFVKADGQASDIAVSYGFYARFRPFDLSPVNGGNASAGFDKVYVYLGQKSLGKITLGRNNTVVGSNKIDGSDVVPGASQNGRLDNNAKSLAASLYNSDIIDITSNGKPFGVSYVTPNIAGVTLGYTYASPLTDTSGSKNATSAVGALGATHDAFIRYGQDFTGGFGTISLAVDLGGRYGNLNGDSSGHVVGYTTGAKLRYTDGKNIGVSLAGGYHNVHNIKTSGYASAWSVGLGLDTPRVKGLTLGALFGQGAAYGKTGYTYLPGGRDGDFTNNSSTADGTLTSVAVSNYHVGAAVGYAWNDNFSQTLSYDKGFGGNVGVAGNGYAWALTNQFSF